MPLTRDDVVDAGLGILDTYGLADLSMRRVADRLGVKAGALYWHVANKQTLLAAVGDEILGGPEGPATVPTDGTDVVTGLMEWARTLRQVLLSHRDGAELVSSTVSVGLGEVDPTGRLREFLRSHGLDERVVDSASRALLHLVLGHVMDEQTRRQLFELHVIGSFDPIEERDDFERGVAMLVGGIAATRSST